MKSIKMTSIQLIICLSFCTMMIGCDGMWSIKSWQRAFSYPDFPVTDTGWYEPKELVKAGISPDLPSASNGLIPAFTASRIAQYAESKGPGALIVLHRGQIVLEHYWGGGSKHHRTASMSLAKTILALAIGVALERKEISSLDEPVSHYLEEWKSDDRGKITIRQLLAMTSGLENEIAEDELTRTVRMHFSEDSNYIAIATPLENKPGKKFSYNNINSQILGVLLERATGTRFADFVSQNIWSKLSNANAFVWLDRPNGASKVYAGFFATARDWAKVGLLLLQKGQLEGNQLISSEWVELMTSPSELEPAYGLHIWRADAIKFSKLPVTTDCPFIAKDLFFSQGKYEQRIYVIPSHQLVIVRVGEDVPNWDECWLPNQIIRSIKPADKEN